MTVQKKSRWARRVQKNRIGQKEIALDKKKPTRFFCTVASLKKNQDSSGAGASFFL